MGADALVSLQNYAGVGIALALGLLIGVERGWAQRREAAGARFAGVRTFGLLGLAGGVAGYLFADAQGLATVVVAAAAALVLEGYWRSSQRGGSISGTASLTGLIALSAGFLAARGETLLATAMAVCTVLLLALRRQIHGWVSRLDEIEVLAIARFALIALVILPLLPDQAFGPFHAWNPRQLWMVVVLVSGFSFAGYVANRMLGPSGGTLATAATGAVVSSTAVTAALGNRMRQGDGAAPLLDAGVAVASVVMAARVLVLTAVIAPFALPTLALLIAPTIVVSAVAAGLFLVRTRRAPPPLPAEVLAVRNPFQIAPALVLMALVMVMTLAAHWVLDRFGDAGLAVVLAISGTADVDSAIITMGSLPPGSLAPQLAGIVLLLPIVLNTLFKGATLLAIAGRRGRAAAAALGLSAAASLIALGLLLA